MSPVSIFMWYSSVANCLTLLVSQNDFLMLGQADFFSTSWAAVKSSLTNYPHTRGLHLHPWDPLRPWHFSLSVTEVLLQLARCNSVTCWLLCETKIIIILFIEVRMSFTILTLNSEKIQCKFFFFCFSYIPGRCLHPQYKLWCS